MFHLPKKLISLVLFIIFFIGSSFLPFSKTQAQIASDVFNDQSIQRKVDQEKQARSDEEKNSEDLQIFWLLLCRKQTRQNL